MSTPHRKPQVCVLGSAEPGSSAYEQAAQAGALLARLGITVVSGCGSPATRLRPNGTLPPMRPPARPCRARRLPRARLARRATPLERTDP